MKTLILIILGFQAGVAMADFEKHQSQSIDFNKMIEANSSEVHKMKKDLSEKEFGSRPVESGRHESGRNASKRVTDFLDVEVGWGEAPKVVDRRFNSIDEPKVAIKPNANSI